MRRSTREIKELERLTYTHVQTKDKDTHCLLQESTEDNTDYYRDDLAPIIAAMMVEINTKSTVEGYNLYQQ